MERNSIFRVLTHGVVVVVLLGLATAPALRAEFACKQELMTGAWITYGNLFGHGDAFGDAGHWSGVGLVVFDEQGFATTAIQTNTTESFFNRIDFLEHFDMRLTVNPDCTGKYTFNDRSTGVLIFEMDAVCGNGQRECHSTFTVTPPPGSPDPPGLIGVWTLKKVEPDPRNERLEKKVDLLQKNLDILMWQVFSIPPAEQ